MGVLPNSLFALGAASAGAMLAHHYNKAVQKQLATKFFEDVSFGIEEKEKEIDRSKCIIHWNKDGSMKNA